MSKAARSAAAKKGARTKKRNKAKRSTAAREGAKQAARMSKRVKSKGLRSRNGKKAWGSPKQRAALKKMQAARGSGTGTRKKRKGKSSKSRTLARSGGGTGFGARVTKLEGRMDNMETFARFQMEFNDYAAPVIAAGRKQFGITGPGRPGLPGALRQLG